MNKSQWDTIKYFSPSENFGDPAKMSYRLLILLDNLREFLERPIVIHCGYEDRQNSSYHCRGMAVDCHCDLNLFDFFNAALRFEFIGVGVYPWWNNPGLHLDVRPLDIGAPKAMWGSIDQGVYTGVTEDLFL